MCQNIQRKCEIWNGKLQFAFSKFDFMLLNSSINQFPSVSICVKELE